MGRGNYEGIKEMKSICFTIPGKPQGKARARTFYNPKTKGMSSMTPEKTVLYENLISTCYLQAAGEERFSDEDYLLVRIQAYFEPAKSVSKKKREEMLQGMILPAKKPDIDNIVKSVLDALNQVAYRAHREHSLQIFRSRIKISSLLTG